MERLKLDWTIAVDVKVTHGCNFSCTQCAHCNQLFRGIVPYESIVETLEKTAKYLDVPALALLGGETTLHPECDKIIETTRRLFPDKPILFITNGSIPKRLKDLTEVFQKTETQVIVSSYDKLDLTEQKTWARENNIHFQIRPYVGFRLSYELDYPSKTINLPLSDNREECFRTCFQKGCPGVLDGYLFKCPLAMMEYVARGQKWSVNCEFIEGDDYCKIEDAHKIDWHKSSQGCNHCGSNIKHDLYRTPIIANKTGATKNNTVFVTVGAYPNRDLMLGFLLSARKHDITVHIQDYQEKWEGFVEHKIIRMRKTLKEYQKQGKEYAFVLDSRDVLFCGTLAQILKRFNDAYNPETVLFTGEYWHSLWPHNPGWLLDALVELTEKQQNQKLGILNAGCYAGYIPNILRMFVIFEEIRNDYLTGKPKRIVSQKLWKEVRDKFKNDDQFFYNIVQFYHPRFIQVDQKNLFANVITSQAWGRHKLRMSFDLSEARSTNDKTNLTAGDHTGGAYILHTTGARLGYGFAYSHGLLEPFETQAEEKNPPQAVQRPCLYGHRGKTMKSGSRTCAGKIVKCYHPEFFDLNGMTEHRRKDETGEYYEMWDKYCGSCARCNPFIFVE